MSELRIYDRLAACQERVLEHDLIAAKLADIGVLFERWDAGIDLHPESGQDEVIEAYREPVDRLMSEYGFQSVDVVGMHPQHPNVDELRGKFLHEHTHGDFEVRFFVDGSGLFYIHQHDRVYAVLCTRGDLISVPGETPHWFDMGASPYFKAIRLFTTPEGWVAQYTGEDIAGRFPTMDEFMADKAA